MTAPIVGTYGARLGVLKTKTIEAASVAALDTAIAAYIATLGAGTQKLVQPFEYRCFDATHYSCMIVFVEG